MGKTWRQLTDQLVYEAMNKRIPISGQFELTSRCNLNCKMCYICQPANNKEAISKERTAKEWINLAEQARREGLLYLLLTGGEVFLRKDFRIIYEELSAMGFIIQIYSNATLITPDISSWLGRTPPSKIEVTMYGASPQTYESVCGYGDGYKHVLRGIDLLLNEGIKLRLKTTVIRDNLKDMDKIIEYAYEKDIGIGIVNYISPRREGYYTDPQAERLSPVELSKFEMYIERELMNMKSDSLKEAYSDTNTVDTNALNRYSSYLKPNDSFLCDAGKSSFWVTWDGKMVPCASMNESTSFPFQIGFHDAWEELHTFCCSIPVCYECKECVNKEVCSSCPARLKSETGFYDKPSKYLCELAYMRKTLKSNKQG